MNKRQLILNGEHFSIEQSAEALGCSIEDIEHYLEIRTIGAYVSLLGYEARSDIAITSLDKVQIEGASVPEELIQKIINSDLSVVNGIKLLENDSEIMLTVQANLEGLWALDHRSTVLLLREIPLCQPRLHSAKRTPNPINYLGGTLPFVYGFSAPKGITKHDIRILKKDLFNLYESLHTKKKPLPNIYSIQSDTEFTSQNLKSRIEAGQTDMISALIHCLPDLKALLDKTPSNAPDIIDDYLQARGLPPVRVGRNTYENWMKKEKYSKKLNAKKQS
ncbi:hypothetical protein [Vibrio diazotrophicus]|uniref:hypothetical protein n=1 Tax=Vibrio diazotrophicus TaxID=685 RepID=UPI0005A83A16|nr:hypothetical protein [Vibrio diazotrophicus]